MVLMDEADVKILIPLSDIVKEATSEDNTVSLSLSLPPSTLAVGLLLLRFFTVNNDFPVKL